jgi:hypothetical protein
MGRIALIALVSERLPLEENTIEVQEHLLKRLIQDMIGENDVLQSWWLEHVKVLEDGDTL